MMKYYLYFLLIIVLLPLGVKGEWVSLDNTKASNTPPQVTLVSDDDNSTVIKIDLAGFEVKDLVTGGKSYNRIDLLSEMFTQDPGKPAVPYIAKVLAVPDQAGVTVEVIETGAVYTYSDIYLPPARKSWIEGAPESPYEEDAGVYQSNQIFPENVVNVEPPSIFRDFRIARVAAYPVRYNPAKRELQVYSSITIRVNYGKGEVINPKTTPKKGITPSFAKLYKGFIFNYESVLNKYYGGKEDEPELILCIMPDAFVSSFQQYADWKRQSGTDVHITKFSDIGANAYNPDIIKNHIADAYHNWEVPPTYVLIVGDDGIFPKKIVTYPDYSFPNEDFFVEIDGNDYFPELMIGRFTNETDYGMQVMINKFLLYEQNPYTESTDWFRKGTVCSNNAYISQVETKRFAYHKMKDDGNFTSVDTLMSDGSYWGGGCTVHLSDVLNAINSGRSFLNYRGEGWSTGWTANCYSFSTGDVSSLNNGQKFTFVTSIGCGVAMFDTYGGNCFGEEWIEEGTLTNPKGACAFLGPTSNTHTTYNNKIDMGIYVGMFQEGMDTPGQALLRGKLYLYNIYGGVYYTEYHFKIYCVLGDPSIHIWKEVPQAINVTHPNAIGVGTNPLDFTITTAAGGQPVANAELCLSGDDVFATGTSDSLGHVFLEITPLMAETIHVTVRGGNVIPYMGTMNVTQEVQLVEPDGEPLVTELDGNMDGLMNPNEHFDLSYTLKNWGYQTATNVQGTLTANEPQYVEIVTSSPVSFGNIATGTTSSGSPFEFYIKPECPVGQTITLNLHVASTTYSWDYTKSYEVMGCRLNFKNFIVKDVWTGNANYKMDPGETVHVAVSIKNAGEDNAPYVTGVLSTNDPNITVEDSIASFGSVSIGAVANCFQDNFEVSVSPSCPTQYMADYSLKLYTENGNYPYQTIKTIHIPVSMPIPTDYTGPDNYGYYAYASNDALFDQTPIYNWVEIQDMGYQINIPPNTTDYTVNVSLPFNFKYYGSNYSVLRVSTDGWMAFGGGDQVAPVNTTIPHNDDVNNMVAVFWDDLYNYMISENGIYYYDDAANHRFIIEWDSIAHNDTVSEPKREDFQAILLDPAFYPTASGNGKIICQYKSLEFTENNTIGIENSSQNVGLQYVYNNDYDPTAAELVNGFAIKFTTDPPSAAGIVTSNEPTIGDGPTSDNFLLGQNNPNPFKGSTEITFMIPEKTHISLKIFNISGELVRTLQNGQVSSGTHTVIWDGLNNRGNTVGSGIYLYRLQTDNFTKTMKMFKLK